MSMSAYVWFAGVIIITSIALYWYQSRPIRVVLQPLPPNDSAVPRDIGTYVQGNLLLGVDIDKKAGKHLIGFSGMTVYTFAHDTRDTSTCTDACIALWVPYTIPSRDVLANVQAGVQRKEGAFVRDDGRLQVSYDGMPLYFYAGDLEAHAAQGSGIDGLWSSVMP